MSQHRCQDCPTPSLLRPFDSSSFMERLDCGNWPDWLFYGWAVPSVLLFLAYFTIGFLVLRFWRVHRTGIPGYPVKYLPWIAAFFFGCGGGHAMNFIAFYWPAYVAFMLWDWYTAATSAVGLFGFVRILTWARKKIRDLESGLQHAITDKQIEEAKSAQQAEQVASLQTDKDELKSQLIRKYEIDIAQNQKKKEELDKIREELEQLLHRQFTDEAYASLRKRLHNLRGM